MSAQQAYFFPVVIVRAPARPLRTDFTEQELIDWAQSAAGREALSLASTELMQQLSRTTLPLPRALRRTLTNYFIRTHSRCTPFGLFAGCGVAHWGTATRLRLAEKGGKCHARPDMEWLRRLTQYLETDRLRDRLHFSPASSLHPIGQQMRYIEVSYLGSEKRYALRSADATPELLALLDYCRKRPVTTAELVAFMIHLGFGEEESTEYVQALIEAQVLESELAPNVTGEPYFARIAAIVRQLLPPDDPLYQWFTDLTRLFDAVNHPATHSRLPLFERITELAHQISLPCEPSRLIQIDMGLEMEEATIDGSVQTALWEAIEVLRILQPPRAQEELEAFRHAFYKQYEEQFVPLTEVLDVDNGLGFPVGNGCFYSELSEHIQLDGPQSTETLYRQTGVGRYLAQRIWEAEQRREMEIRLSREDLLPFSPCELPLPPSATVTFRMLPGGQVVFEGLSGGSGLNLLARFAHLSEAIHQICTDTVSAEEAANPEVLFAEIVHLPEDRVGNILLRPALRPFEIPYLATPGVPPEQCIRLDELLLGVRHNRLVLYCPRLNREIIPRLSSALNFRRSQLPLFRFLCELKTQGLFTNVVFDWTTVVSPRPFFPRLVYRNLVLSPARWFLPRAALRALADAPDEELAAQLDRLAAVRDLPRRFVWSQGDHELLIDRANPLTVRAWLDSVKNLETIEIKEFLSDEAEDSPLTDGQHRPYAHQCMATVINPETVYPGFRPGVGADGRLKRPGLPVRRQFWPGSEWFYCKIYCGWNVKKQVLHTWLVPFVRELQEKNIGQQWFFVNYADPEPHIRLRVRLQTPDFMTEVYRILIESGETREVQDWVRKIQIDTYERELERYEPHLIEQAEWLFWQDSEAVVSILQAEADETWPDWLLWIRGVDFWLDCAGFSLPEKRTFTETMIGYFEQEYPATAHNRRQLNDLYRQHRTAIETLLAADPDWMESLRYQEARRRTMLKQIQGRCSDFQRLMASYIHMFLNRLNPVEQRLHEFTYYYFLSKAYKTRLAVGKTKKWAGDAEPTHSNLLQT